MEGRSTLNRLIVEATNTDGRTRMALRGLCAGVKPAVTRDTCARLVALPGRSRLQPVGPMLKPGDIVKVRVPAEIMATLDDNGSLDSVLFMP
jgi:hypothetical protein